MQQENARDLGWLKILVSALNTGNVTLEQAIAYLGEDAGIDPLNPTHHLVTPWSKHIKSARVYPLGHIAIPVAIDIEFAQGSTPQLASLQALFGDFKRAPRNPGDFYSGDKFVHFHRPGMSPMRVRIFAELSSSNRLFVVKLHVDAEKASS
jgi:hypothetical protein